MDVRAARCLIVGLYHCHAHTDADVVKAPLHTVRADQEVLVNLGEG